MKPERRGNAGPWTPLENSRLPLRGAYLDIEFPTVVHRPWKSLRDFHIPTAPIMLPLQIETQNPKKGAPASCLP
jgi:hypothetical protein